MSTSKLVVHLISFWGYICTDYLLKRELYDLKFFIQYGVSDNGYRPE